MFNLRLVKITAVDLFWLMQQLSILISAEIPLVKALQNILALQKQAAVKQLLQTLIQTISQGASFSQALRYYPKYFSEFTCQLMQAGEQTATLSLALMQWIAYQTQLQQLAQKLRKALFYPTIVISLSLIITLGLLLFIVPQFQQLFASFNAPLPWLTRGILTFTELLKSYGLYGFLALILMIFLLKIIIKYFPTFARLIALWQLRIPFLGQWQRLAIVARTFRTLALTLSHHIPLPQGLTLSSGIAQHWHYQQALQLTKTWVTQGQTLADALQKTACFDLFLIQLIRTGEQSGRLAPLLQQAADWYDNQLDRAVDQLSQWLEPMIMAILGVLIGGLVVAMYLPIFQLGTVI